MEISEKKIEELELSRMRMTITVPAQDVRSEYDAMMNEYAKQARIDGFRKGHVPVSVLERKFGTSLKTDAMARVVEKALETALKDVSRPPLAYEMPTLEDDPSFELDSDFIFSVIYDTFPVFELPSLDGIEIEVPNVTITQEDLDRELENIRQRNAIVAEKDGPSEIGDIVTANFAELAEDGSEIPGTSRQDFSFELGKNLNIYKFDDEIIGLKAGDEKTIIKTFPDDFEFPEYAGKTVTIKVLVNKVKHQDLPNLDDELAQDVSEKYKTLDDLKEAVRAHLTEDLEAKLRKTKENAIMDELLKRMNISIPRSMLTAELAMRWESLKQQTGVDSDEHLEMLLAMSGKTHEKIFQEWEPLAEKALATNILLDKLIEAGSYTSTDEEVDAEIAKEASHTTMSPAEIKAEYEKHGTIKYIKEDIAMRKFFDNILSSVMIKESAPMSYLDFMKRND
ncbi:MAG: Trigger factor [Spirochaetes bacterium ADurb.Bin110]|nr:MAG: Trigger factor [Spirochaetes bacterium ADurb.Bin110]